MAWLGQGLEVALYPVLVTESEPGGRGSRQAGCAVDGDPGSAGASPSLGPDSNSERVDQRSTLRYQRTPSRASAASTSSKPRRSSTTRSACSTESGCSAR